MNENHVDYGMTNWLGFLAVAIGGVIAVGVPWVVLTNASNAGMNAITITVLSIMGVFGGVSLAVVAAIRARCALLRGCRARGIGSCAAGKPLLGSA